MTEGTHTVFVTAFMDVGRSDPCSCSAPPVGERTLAWRLEKFAHMAATGVPLRVVVDQPCLDVLTPLLELFPNVHIVQVLDIAETWTFQQIPDDIALPVMRNVTKDTRAYLALMHAKAEFVAHVAKYEDQATHVCWVDFNLFHIFPDIHAAQDRLRHLAAVRTWRCPLAAFPGCWPSLADKHGDTPLVAGTAVHHDLLDKPYWRFCGGVFLVDRGGAQTLGEIYRTHFPRFLSVYRTLVWEVNFWAWLEREGVWSASWYAADHDLSILAVPTDHLAVRAMDVDKHVAPFLAPPVQGDGGETYRASSVAVARHPILNTWVFNTRYVNYTIDPHGLYVFQGSDTCLRTKNVVAVHPACRNDEGATGGAVVAVPEAFQHLNAACEGLEDLRLFAEGDVLRFVASCTFEDGRIGMVQGTYDVEGGRAVDVVRLPSPKDAWCEKNWTPLGEGRFIYQWSPMEVWRYDQAPDQVSQPASWVLERTVPTDAFPWLRAARGSTPLVPFGDGLLVGLVHFSEGSRPRHYFHVVVVLERETLRPVKTSVPMVFDALGIEFCTGMVYQEGTMYAWVSRYDRDPVLVCLDETRIPWYTL